MRDAIEGISVSSFMLRWTHKVVGVSIVRRLDTPELSVLLRGMGEMGERIPRKRLPSPQNPKGRVAPTRVRGKRKVQFLMLEMKRFLANLGMTRVEKTETKRAGKRWMDFLVRPRRC